MKKPKIVSILLVLCLALAWSIAPAKEEPKNGKRVAKTSVTFSHTYFLINNIFSQFANTMESDVELTSGQNSGFEWPKGSGKTAVYESGFVYAGFYEGKTSPTAAPSHRKFVNGSVYISGMTEGWITNPGAGQDPPQAGHISPSDPLARVFRVRPDINPYNTQTDAAGLTKKLQDEEVGLIQRFTTTSASTLYDEYVKDWNEWPATQGAPFKDVNGNGTYEPAIDIPGVPGADQTLWFVCNDMVAATSQALAGAGAQGIEIQKTIWGYNLQSALGNVYFAKWTLINKSGADIDTMYNCFWTDIDLGFAGDDFAGVDVGRQLGYNYNGKGFDQVYGDACPASGFAFFQGPLVAGAATDSGIFKGAYRHGFKNLKMSAFDPFINGGGNYGDPPQGNSTAARDQWWNLLTGHIGVTGGAWIDPTTGDTTSFVFSGDPVTGTGWLDGSFAPPGDRRFCETAGPFNLAPGDTQEIVVGGMVGQGADRISSVTAIRATCDEAQAAYNNFFVLPKSCPPPNLTITPMDGAILMTWGDPADVKAIEQDYNLDPASKGYTFEAYRVYQTQTQSFTNPKVVAVYDIATDPVLDNNGVQHYIQITTDKFTSKPLVNGSPYYFGVSTLSYNPASFPILLEKAPSIVQIIPQSPLPGNRLGSAYADTVGYAHTAGIADATLGLTVVNPQKVTGDNYQIQIVYTDSVLNAGTGLMVPNYKWQVYDVTKGIVAKPPSTNFINNATNEVVDGLSIGFKAAPFYVPGTEIAKQEYFPSSHFNFTGVNWGGGYFGGGLDIGENWRGSELTGSQITQTIEVRFDSTGFDKAAQTGASKAYLLHRTTGSGTAAYAGYFAQPFSVYNVTDPANPKQIDFMFMVQTGAAYDSVWHPTTSSGDREYFYLIDTAYTATAKALFAGKTEAQLCPLLPIVYGGWYTLTDGALPAYHNGDVWRITATKPVTSIDRWNFTTSGKQMTFSTANQKNDAKVINVFPNPYFGFQPLEQTRYQRFVTFNHLPQKATIRIFTLSGQLVRSFSKDDPSQFFQWDLKNGVGIPVASGVYVVHIDLPDVGTSKILKLSVIQPQQILDHL